METHTRVLTREQELEKIRNERIRAVKGRERAEFLIHLQSRTHIGFSQTEKNKHLGLTYARTRAEEMLQNMDIRRVPMGDLAILQPLVAFRGVGYAIAEGALAWIHQVINYPEEILTPEIAWVAIKTEGRRGQEKCLIVEAEETDLDQWVRLRRNAREHTNGTHTALPFLLFEEALRRPHIGEDLAGLAKALIRRG